MSAAVRINGVPVSPTARAAAEPFDVDEGELSRVIAVRIGEDHAALVVVTHHLVIDGISHPMLARRMARAITGTLTEQSESRYVEVVRHVLENEERSRRTDSPHWHARLREHGDLDAATQHLLRSKELGEHTGFPQNPYRWRVAMARIREAQGDLDGALDLLHEAERLYVGDFFPNVRPVAALKARVWVAQGRLGEALGWARERACPSRTTSATCASSSTSPWPGCSWPAIRAIMADRSLLEAMGLLERLLQAAEEGGRTGSVIEILVLQALAHQMQGDIPAALVPLQRALTLAEPEGYVRMFVDEGPPMAACCERPRNRGSLPSYVRQLLAAFGETRTGRLGRLESERPVKQALIEPLSERELEVLRLLGTELSGPEIASELMVSLNTMRTHTKNIYNKLGVNNRRAAVRRAEELDLL